MKRVYFDSNSAMPTMKEVVDEMLPYFTEHFGNPSSIHELGREPRKAMETARESVAALINADPAEIIFTSGATESINLALRGPVPFRAPGRSRIVISNVDHHSVRATSAALETTGLKRSLLPINDEGKILIEDAERIVGDDVYMVSVPFASYEVGTLQPVKEISALARERDALFHIDLTTSAFQVPFDVKKIHADLVTLSSVDLMGPKGVGALYIRKGTKISSLMKGGGHERGLRSGSENIPGIVGMGAAARIVKDRMADHARELTSIRDHIISGLLKIPDSHLNGHPSERLPNNANIRFDYIEGESMLLMLDMNGISVSTGSACTQKNLEPSKTLLAMGLKHEEAHGSLQFSLNPNNKMDDAEYVVAILPEIVEQLREMSPLYNR
ncbi:MAG: cysteine desulfurase family protein [Thermoplasmatota archaeon]